MDLPRPERSAPDAQRDPPDTPVPAPEPAGAAPDIAGAAGPDAGSPPATAGAGQPDPEVDLGRRYFFRSLSREAIQTAAMVMGAATALQRGTATATNQLLGLVAEPPAPAAEPLPGFATAPAEPGVGFTRPYRLVDDELLLVDQRRLPEQLLEVSCLTGVDVAAAIRDGAVRGGPVLGLVAAYGTALTAARVRDASPYMRSATLHGTLGALRSARPAARAIDAALDRMERRWGEIGEDADPDLLARELRAEAEAIALQAQTDHALLGRHGAELLGQPAERPLEVLLHGTVGPLGGGGVGTALSVVSAVVGAGRGVHCWVCEERPSLHGARVTPWELQQADLPHTLVADGAAGWLFAQGQLEAVLVSVDRVARNGDTAAPLGTYPLAVLAARHGVPLYACAPLASFDPEAARGDALRAEERSADEVLQVLDRRSAPLGTRVRNPSVDVTPGELIAGFVTEAGILRPPYERTLAGAVGTGATGERS